MVNAEIFNFINGFVGKSFFLDKLMIFTAESLVLFIPLFFIYLFLKNKTKSLFVFLSVLISLILNQLIGFLFIAQGPLLLAWGCNWLNMSANASFPSDHATTFFAFGFALLFAKYRVAGVVFLILGVLVGFSRIFVGIHFPLDVLGSLLFSFIVVALFYLIEVKYLHFFLKKRL